MREGARQALVLLAALALCPVAALLIGSDPAEPVARGLALVEAQRDLGLLFEPALHAWLLARDDLLAAANVFYVWAHVPVAGWALVWTWMLRRDVFFAVRDAFLWTQLLLVACYVALPTAPPRLLGVEGFSDTLAGMWGRGLADSAHLLQSPYAAMPSGHVAFALVAGLTFARYGDQPWLRVFGWAYPPLVALVTFATGNHLWLDAAGAVAVAAVSVLLARVRPWPRSKRTSRAPSGRSNAPWATGSTRATPSSSSSR